MAIETRSASLQSIELNRTENFWLAWKVAPFYSYLVNHFDHVGYYLAYSPPSITDYQRLVSEGDFKHLLVYDNLKGIHIDGRWFVCEARDVLNLIAKTPKLPSSLEIFSLSLEIFSLDFNGNLRLHDIFESCHKIRRFSFCGGLIIDENNSLARNDIERFEYTVHRHFRSGSAILPIGITSLV